MRIAVLTNPISGRGRSAKRARSVVELAKKRGHEVVVRESGGPGQPEAIARDLSDDSWNAIVIAGGDGTVNESLNGFVDPTAVPLAPLACGTANLLARELMLPCDAAPFLDMIEAGVTRRLDLGVANGRRFLLVLSVGFDAMVIDEIHRSRNGKLGFRGYIKPVLKTLSSYRRPRITVRLGAEEEQIAGEMVVVSNVKHYAGVLSITDRALCDSGELDVCIFPKASIPKLVGYAIAARRRRVSTLKSVCYRFGTRVVIESEEPVPVEIDGEAFGMTPVEIDVLPKCVPIMVPAAQVDCPC
ncbi:MAG: diacylglycerol/lipid kinase family protein [Phycisphaerales bacterium]